MQESNRCKSTYWPIFLKSDQFNSLQRSEKFYREKRMLLQEAAAKIQADAYATTGPANSENV